MTPPAFFRLRDQVPEKSHYQQLCGRRGVIQRRAKGYERLVVNPGIDSRQRFRPERCSARKTAIAQGSTRRTRWPRELSQKQTLQAIQTLLPSCRSYSPELFLSFRFRSRTLAGDIIQRWLQIRPVLVDFEHRTEIAQRGIVPLESVRVHFLHKLPRQVGMSSLDKIEHRIPQRHS